MAGRRDAVDVNRVGQIERPAALVTVCRLSDSYTLSDRHASGPCAGIYGLELHCTVFTAARGISDGRANQTIYIRIAGRISHPRNEIDGAANRTRRYAPHIELCPG